MREHELRVAFVSVTSPGYRSLAVDYLQAAVAADPRAAAHAVVRIDADIAADPWWTAYRLLQLTPAPDVVAFPVQCWTARHVYECARIIKAALPDAYLVAGGPEVSPIAEDVLAQETALDAVVRGEGEVTFSELLYSLARGGEPSDVLGVTARLGDHIVSAPDRESIADLDSVASPYAVRPQATDGTAYLETYRGCPHSCAYCFEGKGSTRIRSFSWERIAADIDTLAGTPGMTAFSFIDPVFNLTPDRLQQLSDLLAPHAARGVRLHTIEVDIERIDDEAAVLLKRAGVVSVETGPQTTGAAALGACDRSFDPDRFAAGVAACRRAGISVECDLIIGLPGDTTADVLASLDFALSLDPGKVQLSSLHVLPGTALWDHAEELGLVFDREPPHELIATRDLSYGGLRRLELFGRAAAQVYRARIGP